MDQSTEQRTIRRVQMPWDHLVSMRKESARFKAQVDDLKLKKDALVRESRQLTNDCAEVGCLIGQERRPKARYGSLFDAAVRHKVRRP